MYLFEVETSVHIAPFAIHVAPSALIFFAADIADNTPDANPEVAAALGDAIPYGRFFLERFARGFFTTEIP